MHEGQPLEDVSLSKDMVKEQMGFTLEEPQYALLLQGPRFLVHPIVGETPRQGAEHGPCASLPAKCPPTVAGVAGHFLVEL